MRKSILAFTTIVILLMNSCVIESRDKKNITVIKKTNLKFLDRELILLNKNLEKSRQNQKLDIEFLNILKKTIDRYEIIYYLAEKWSIEKKYRFKIDLAELKKEFYMVKTSMAMQAIIKQLDTTNTSKEKIKVLNQWVNILTTEIKRGLYSVKELLELKIKITESENEKEQIKKRIRELNLLYKEKLSSERKYYVGKHNVIDLSLATKYFKINNAKLFYESYDMTQIQKAWNLCQRIEKSDYTPIEIKNKSILLKYKIKDLLSDFQLATCKELFTPYYDRDADYPRWSPTKKAEEDFQLENIRKAVVKEFPNNNPAIE